MSFSVRLSKNLITEDLIRRFAPFKQKECRLPDCAVRLLDASAEVPAGASILLERCLSDPRTRQVNEYRFTPCEDGVLIAEDRPIRVWVHDAWRQIDAFVEPPMQLSPGLHTLMMRAYQYTALHAGALLMHAAAVVYDDQGILFCGVPGAGKSTQARLWERTFGAQTINNDQPCIIYEDGRALVSGTPWSGKEPCYTNLCVPVRAVVFVEKSPEDRVEMLNHAEAYSLLYLNEYVIPIQPETEAVYAAAIEKLTRAVPICRQFCTMTENAPRTLRAFLDAGQE